MDGVLGGSPPLPTGEGAWLFQGTRPVPRPTDRLASPDHPHSPTKPQPASAKPTARGVSPGPSPRLQNSRRWGLSRVGPTPVTLTLPPRLLHPPAPSVGWGSELGRLAELAPLPPTCPLHFAECGRGLPGEGLRTEALGAALGWSSAGPLHPFKDQGWAG